ncbi:MAG: hypothetical protein ACKOBX_06510 [Bacteroidota bacterium]
MKKRFGNEDPPLEKFILNSAVASVSLRSVADDVPCDIKEIPIADRRSRGPKADADK